MTCRAVDASAVPLDEGPLDAEQVRSGNPVVGSAVLGEIASLEVGLWEHSIGTSTDTEADEVFVVLSGRATVLVEGGPTLELYPGVVSFLTQGAKTTWTVHETLRKVYVTR